MIKIIDDFLPAHEWEACLNYFKGGHWSFPPISGDTSKTCVWRIFNPVVESNVGRILYKQLETLDTQPLAVKRVGINGATTYNESHIHVDGPFGDYTLIWFGSPKWDISWDGYLTVFKDEECWKTAESTKNPDVSKGSYTVQYVPNRAVIFPSHLAHVPQTPSVEAKNNLRVSVGLHLKPTDFWNYIYIPRTNNG